GVVASKMRSIGSTRVRVLITGGCGFVGAFTALEFVEQGHEVVCYDRRAVRNDVLERAGPDGVIVEGDVQDRERLAAVVREHGIEGIAHTAAVIGQEGGASDPDWMININVGGTVAVLETARANSLRMVYVSTATLYGQHPDLHTLTEDA